MSDSVAPLVADEHVAKRKPTTVSQDELFVVPKRLMKASDASDFLLWPFDKIVVAIGHPDLPDGVEFAQLDEIALWMQHNIAKINHERWLIVCEYLHRRLTSELERVQTKASNGKLTRHLVESITPARDIYSTLLDCTVTVDRTEFQKFTAGLHQLFFIFDHPVVQTYFVCYEKFGLLLRRIMAATPEIQYWQPHAMYRSFIDRARTKCSQHGVLEQSFHNVVVLAGQAEMQQSPDFWDYPFTMYAIRRIEEIRQWNVKRGRLTKEQAMLICKRLVCENGLSHLHKASLYLLKHFVDMWTLDRDLVDVVYDIIHKVIKICIVNNVELTAGFIVAAIKAKSFATGWQSPFLSTMLAIERLFLNNMPKFKTVRQGRETLDYLRTLNLDRLSRKVTVRVNAPSTKQRKTNVVRTNAVVTNRPTVSSNTLPRRPISLDLTDSDCLNVCDVSFDKTLRIWRNGVLEITSDASIVQSSDDMEITSNNEIPLVCPISGNWIIAPARFHGCTDLRYFDLESFIAATTQRRATYEADRLTDTFLYSGKLKCPLCGKKCKWSDGKYRTDVPSIGTDLLLKTQIQSLRTQYRFVDSWEQSDSDSDYDTPQASSSSSSLTGSNGTNLPIWTDSHALVRLPDGQFEVRMVQRPTRRKVDPASVVVEQVDENNTEQQVKTEREVIELD